MVLLFMPRGGKRAGAGRPKGSLGAMTERVLELFDELKFDPLRELVALYQNSETDKRTKVRIAIELAQVVAPKLKAIDVQTANNPGIIVNVVQYAPQPRIVKVDAQSPKCLLRPQVLALDESTED
jgi:hypothetical protein